jgi:hypothetical protein
MSTTVPYWSNMHTLTAFFRLSMSIPASPPHKGPEGCVARRPETREIEARQRRQVAEEDAAAGNDAQIREEPLMAPILPTAPRRQDGGARLGRMP